VGGGGCVCVLFEFSGQNQTWLPTMGDEVTNKKEIYTHEAPWTVYGLSWSQHPGHPYRLALGSFLDDYTNKVNIVKLNEQKGSFDVTHEFDHPYPCTKLAWIPDRVGSRPDLIASTADYLRLWQVEDGKVSMKSLLNNVRHVMIINNIIFQIFEIAERLF